VKLGGDREDHRERKRKRQHRIEHYRYLHRVLWESKWLSGEALQIAVKRREVKSKGEGNGTPLQYACLENPMD